MERRDAIRYTAVFMGTSLSASTIAALISGCTVDDSVDWRPGFFTLQEVHFIRELGETILPKTTTPGAKEALVDRYLDTIRPLRYTTEENKKFREELASMMQKANEDLGKDFGSVPVPKQLQWVQEVDKASFDLVAEKPDMTWEEKPFYLKLKEQILGGYFSSEKVAKEYFAYDPVPGRYESCIPYEDIGRAWAL